MATMQSMSPCAVTPASCISLHAAPECFLGERVRLRRRGEAGNVALEEQLAPRRILERERDERTQELLERRAGISGELQRFEPLEQLPVAVGEHRVVQRVLRVEVLVEGRLAHPDLAGQGMQRDPGDAVLPSELPRRSDDRRHLGLAALRHRVRHHSLPWEWVPITDRYFTYYR